MRAWAPIVAAVLAVGGGCAALGHRAIYGSWPGEFPTRVEYCDRTYGKGSTVPAEELRRTKLIKGKLVPPVVGWRVYGEPPEPTTLPSSAQPARCGTGVYLQLSSSEFLQYGLEGGP